MKTKQYIKIISKIISKGLSILALGLLKIILNANVKTQNTKHMALRKNERSCWKIR